MKNKTRILTSVGALLFLLLSFNHCVIEQKTNNRGKTGDDGTNTDSTFTQTNNGNTNGGNLPPPINGGNPPPIIPPPSTTNATPVDVGVKSFDQINITMAVLTGVDPTDNNIKNTYEEIKAQLPTDNNVKSFLPANQVAITKLAAEYCDRLVESGSLRSAVWPNFNFTQSAAQTFANASIAGTFIQQSMDRFWGPGMQDAAETAEKMGHLQVLVGQLLAGENINSQNVTRSTAKGICIAVLSSANVALQ